MRQNRYSKYSKNSTRTKSRKQNRGGQHRNKSNHFLVTLVAVILLIAAVVLIVYKTKHAFEPTPTSSAVVSPTPTMTPSATPTTPAPLQPTATPTRRVSLDPSVSPTPACTPAANFNSLVNPEGKTIETRFLVPDGWERISVPKGSYAEYLRTLPLKDDGELLHYWDGTLHPIPAHAAILDMKMPSKYEQCADTAIHLYCNYLYENQLYDKMRFTFNNGFSCTFRRYIDGYRPNSEKNGWEKKPEYWTGATDRVYKVFLDDVFLYANSNSLFEHELLAADIKDLSIGDLFVVPGFPGHVVIVSDVIINKTTGEKRFLTVQGSMPAVQAHVMMNAEEPSFSPWQNTRFEDGYFYSATYWGCPVSNLRRFR